MFVCGVGLRAQVVDSAQLLIKYVPKLANSNKINQQAVLKDTVVSEKMEFNYVVAPTKPNVQFAAGDMQVGKLNPEVKEGYYRNYIKIGFGYPITPLAELSMHNCQSQKYSYGLNFHHFSSWANPIGKEQKKYAYAPMSDTRVHLFFNRIFKNYTLYSAVDYNHELANLYGYSRDWVRPEIYPDPDQYYDKPYRDSIKNNFNHVRAEVGFRSNYTAEERRLKEDVRVSYDFLRTSWKNVEHNVGLRGMLAYDAKFMKISGMQHYQLDLGLDYYNNSWNDSVPMGTDGSLLRPRVDSASNSSCVRLCGSASANIICWRVSGCRSLTSTTRRNARFIPLRSCSSASSVRCSTSMWAWTVAANTLPSRTFFTRILT